MNKKQKSEIYKAQKFEINLLKFEVPKDNHEFQLNLEKIKVKDEDGNTNNENKADDKVFLFKKETNLFEYVFC